MPTYDYQCRSCGVITEIVHSMLDDGPSECDRCGGQLRRVVHPTGIIFRGSGFYKNDSRSPSGNIAGGSHAPTQPSGEGSAPAAKANDPAPTDKATAPAASVGDTPKIGGGSD